MTSWEVGKSFSLSLGFTGTQEGMTPAQWDHLNATIQLYRNNYHVEEFHHGDCIGADVQAALIAYSWGIPVIGHPPSDPKKRAFFPPEKSLRIDPELPYLDRNKIIVDETDELIATPKEFTEQVRSGTWSTIRYARKLSRPITIIWPDGTAIFEGGHHRIRTSTN